MTDKIPVLIIGAGPTGLVMACQLLMRGVECKIVDRLEQPVTTSRAFTIHARTLELLQMMGLHDEYQGRGFPVKAMQYHFMGKDESPYLDFTEIDSPYPFCLNISQTDTEAILRDKLAALGGVIEWGTQVESLQEQADSVVCEAVNRVTGETSRIEADWVVGCDGYRSVVRQSMDIPFDGEEYIGTEMKMMDVAVEGFEEPTDRIHYFITKDHLLLFAKLPNEHYRVLISDMGGAQTETVREAFQQVADIHFQGRVQIGEPVWATNFKISRRKVDTFRQGRIFLAGDAAHVNSPAGGQGMNASIQDAFNLSWKLADVVNGQSDAGLLDTYEQERNPVAAQVVEGTHFLNSIIMAHGRNMEDRIALTRAPGWNRKAVNQISGVSYTYRSATAEEDEPDLALAAFVGDRCPHCWLANGQNLYDYLNHKGYTLLYIVGGETSAETVSSYYAAALGFCDDFAIDIKPLMLVPSDALQAVIGADAIVDSASAVTTDSVYLIRPDGYIAAASPATQVDALRDILTDHYFVNKKG